MAALADQAEARKADVVYGAWEPIIDSFFKECASIAYVAAPVLVEGQPIRPCFIASALMHRAVWEKVGGFPEHLRSAEDLLFMDSIQKANFQIVRAPAALVRWQMQPTLWKTFKRFVVYARYNIRAGLWRKWQAAIFGRYALVGIVTVPAIFFGIKWLIVPLLFWLSLLLARAIEALRRNRHSYPATISRNGLRLLLIVPIIATLDAAAFAGTISWLLRDKLRLAPMGHDDDSGG